MLEYLKPLISESHHKKLLSIVEERSRWTEQLGNKRYLDLLDSLHFKVQASLDESPQGAIRFTEIDKLTPEEKKKIEAMAKKLIPWRKGPFDLFGLEIDAEWRSEMKWNRIKSHSGKLEGKRVLDIGSNNGYYLFQIMKDRPALALGIEPFLHYYTQFKFLNHFYHHKSLQFELLGVEHVGYFDQVFDVILSMGIIYHHRHPLEQLQMIFHALRPGGKLILETIGIPGQESMALFPEDRYAQMGNVWFVPTLPCLMNWLKRTHFENIELISDTLLTGNEQRLTAWCPPPYQSLEDFLSKADPSQTVEGHPAPRRMALVATKPLEILTIKKKRKKRPL